MQCALRYTALDAASRRRVWDDLLAHASIAVDADIDTAALSGHELNGRQIKNALQLAVGEAQTGSTRLLVRVQCTFLRSHWQVAVLGDLEAQALPVPCSGMSLPVHWQPEYSGRSG